MAKNLSTTIEKRLSRVKSGSRLPSSNENNRNNNYSTRANSAPPKKTNYRSSKEIENLNKFEMHIPCKKINKINPNDRVKAKIITAKEYEYFRSIAMDGLMTNDEKEAQRLIAEEKKKKLHDDCIKRKEKMKIIDLKKMNNKSIKLDSLEAEARQKKMHILERANDLKLEQEEEIQMCNRLILETKCRAIRDAQVAEKKIIEKELNNEEKRLNDLMENERKIKLKEEEKKLEDELIRKHKFAKLLRNQIIENEEQRIIEFERKQEEGRLINKSNDLWHEDELKKAQRKKELNDKIRKDIETENEKLMKFKQIEREEARLMDLRIREYQKKKEDREKELIELQRKEKLRKENEKLEIATKTLESRDYQEKIDELNATRIQEEVERNWRKREKEDAMKKLELRKKLALARQEQINNRKLLQAMEIERDRREFEKIISIQKEAICREKIENEEKQRNANHHRIQILKQVNEKEMEKINLRRKIFEEGIAMRAEIEMRKKKLKNAMEKKCDIMRSNKVPEIYINEVKNLIEKVK